MQSFCEKLSLCSITWIYRAVWHEHSWVKPPSSPRLFWIHKMKHIFGRYIGLCRFLMLCMDSKRAKGRMKNFHSILTRDLIPAFTLKFKLLNFPLLLIFTDFSEHFSFSCKQLGNKSYLQWLNSKVHWRIKSGGFSLEDVCCLLFLYPIGESQVVGSKVWWLSEKLCAVDIYDSLLFQWGWKIQGLTISLRTSPCVFLLCKTASGPLAPV